MKKVNKYVLAILIVAVLVGAVYYGNVLDVIVPAEDLTSYTELDPLDFFNVESNTITTTNLRRDESPYVMKDFGANYFDGDFEHYLRIKVTDSESHGMQGFWMLNQLESTNNLLQAMNSQDGLTFYLYRYSEGDNATDLHRFILYDRESTKPIQESYIHYSPNAQATMNTDYWVTIKRYGYDLILQIHSDSARTQLLHETSYILEQITPYRYAYVAYCYGRPGDSMMVSTVTSDYHFQSPPPYESPVAHFTWTPTLPEVNELITFDASGSGTGGVIESYKWDFNNDGVWDYTSTSPTTDYSYPSSGSKIVSLEVTDDLGQTGTTIRAVTVNPSGVQTYPLTVYTKNSNGDIIGGSSVTIQPGGFNAYSNVDGVIIFDLESGTYTVTVAALGYEIWKGTVTISDSASSLTSANLPEGSSPVPGFEILALLSAIGVAIWFRRKKG